MQKFAGLIVALGVLGLLFAPASATEQQPTDAHAEVLPYLDVTFNYDIIDFDEVTTDSVDNPMTYPLSNEVNTTVDTNANWLLNIESINDFDSTYWGIDKMKVDVNKTVGNVSLGSASYLPVQGNYADLVNGTHGQFTHYFGYWVDVPSYVPSNHYTAEFQLTYLSTL